MTASAADIAALSALLTGEVRSRRPADQRAEDVIATAILAEIGFPAIGRQLLTLRRKRAARQRGKCPEDQHGTVHPIRAIK